MKIQHRLGEVASLLDGAGFLEQQFVSELTGNFHAQRLGVKLVGLRKIRLGRVRHVGIRLGRELVGKGGDDPDKFLFALGG